MNFCYIVWNEKYLGQIYLSDYEIKIFLKGKIIVMCMLKFLDIIEM